MKFKVLLFCLLTFFFLPTEDAQAQEGAPYKSAIGARLSYGIGATYKLNLNDKSAIELMASAPGFRDFRVAGFYEVHIPITKVDGLRAYYGGGPTLRFFTFSSSLLSNYLAIGVAGIGGCEYTFENLPINLSLDFSPGIYIFNTANGVDLDLDFASGWGISCRYTFK